MSRRTASFSRYFFLKSQLPRFTEASALDWALLIIESISEKSLFCSDFSPSIWLPLPCTILYQTHSESAISNAAITTFRIISYAKNLEHSRTSWCQHCHTDSQSLLMLSFLSSFTGAGTSFPLRWWIFRAAPCCRRRPLCLLPAAWAVQPCIYRAVQGNENLDEAGNVWGRGRAIWSRRYGGKPMDIGILSTSF